MSAGATALGGALARNPLLAGGSTAFFVATAFVAANALWYQPGLHPHPIFRTRDPQSSNVLGARRPAEEQQGDVTTFRIERPEDATATNATPAPPAAAQQPSQLVMDIQQQLVRRGLYNGTPDGIIGPRTSNQLTDALDALQVSLTPEDQQRLDAVAPPGRATVPYYGYDGMAWVTWGPHRQRW